MKFLMVDVKDINATVPGLDDPLPIPTNSEDTIEALSDAILATELLRPLILLQTDLQEYQLVDGIIEYYAALKAKEKNPRKGEMVNAFVISENEYDAVIKQLEILK